MIDPQHRVLLSLSAEATASAMASVSTWSVADDPRRHGLAQPWLEAARQSTGVFLGLSWTEYKDILLLADRGGQMSLPATAAQGTLISAAAGRISYTLGFTGPCLVVDTACSSSLVACHQACLAMQMQTPGSNDSSWSSNSTRLGITGGAETFLLPSSGTLFEMAAMLYPTGRCKTLSTDADGYVRSEAVVVHVLAQVGPTGVVPHVPTGGAMVVVGSGVNQDGRSAGITAPNGPAQTTNLRTVLQNSGRSTRELAHVYLHGTGTALGDPIEVGALERVVSVSGEGSNPQRPV